MIELGSRKVNGHSLSLTAYHDQGGGWEEISVWCHVCDPKGKHTKVYLVSEYGVRNCLELATAYAKDHEALEPK